MRELKLLDYTTLKRKTSRTSHGVRELKFVNRLKRNKAQARRTSHGVRELKLAFCTGNKSVIGRTSHGVRELKFADTFSISLPFLSHLAWGA